MRKKGYDAKKLACLQVQKSENMMYMRDEMKFSLVVLEMEVRPEKPEGTGRKNGRLNQAIKFETGPKSNGTHGRGLTGTRTNSSDLQKGQPG